jgi:guanylate kinase
MSPSRPTPGRPGVEAQVRPASGDPERGRGVGVPGTRSPLIGAPGALLIIISGPSGVGKDTVIAALRGRQREPDYHYTVTCTTRAPRHGETDGVSYRFMSGDAFEALRHEGQLLEAAEVHGHWYGTPRRDVGDALASGRDVILKIDVQGAEAVKKAVPDALLIFIVPPSLETLFARLRARATESADELELRQRNAAIELAHRDDYDHVVVNETGRADETARRIDEIVAAERLRHDARRIRI